MQDLIDRLVQEAGVTPGQAKKSIETIAIEKIMTMGVSDEIEH